MIELRKLIPDAEVLLKIPVEELAGKVLFALRKHIETEANNFLSLGDLVELLFRDRSDLPSYPSELESMITLAVYEAFGWLEAQGLIVRNYNAFWGVFVLSRRAMELEDGHAFSAFRAGRLLPREVMHPDLLPDVWLDFVRGRLDHAVWQSMKAVEVAVRRAGEFAKDVCGDDLFKAAFKPDGGALTNSADPGGEREGLFFTYRGMFLRYRNSHGHRYAEAGAESPEDAIGVILMASHLLREIDRIEVRLKGVQPSKAAEATGAA